MSFEVFIQKNIHIWICVIYFVPHFKRATYMVTMHKDLLDQIISDIIIEGFGLEWTLDIP